MKNFDYAQTKKTKKRFKMPRLKTQNYDIVWFALPIAPFFILYDKLQKRHYESLVWSEEKAIKVLDYFLPYVLEWSEEDKAYWYCLDWRYTGWNISKKAPVGLKKWTRKFGYEVMKYLKDSYEKEGFVKTLEKDDYEAWIKFEKVFDI